jgi:hypothetical protein
MASSNEYPTNMTKLLSTINNWEAKSSQYHHQYMSARMNDNGSLNFAQEGMMQEAVDKPLGNNDGVKML